MARYSGTTEERGLGWAHQSDRKRLLALHHDGDPCWRCGQPMYKSQPLNRDHVVDRALGGADGPAVLAHEWCNKSAGARLGNQLYPRNMRTMVQPGRDTICRTCGKVYSRAPRICEICGAHYHPNHGAQRSCSRACGVKLRQRLYGHAGNAPKSLCACGNVKPGKAARCSRCNQAARQEAALQRTMAAPGSHSKIVYYTCKYCGELGVTTARGEIRQVCPARACQTARLAANNLIARKGMTRERADAQVAAVVASGQQGSWQQARRW